MKHKPNTEQIKNKKITADCNAFIQAQTVIILFVSSTVQNVFSLINSMEHLDMI